VCLCRERKRCFIHLVENMLLCSLSLSVSASPFTLPFFPIACLVSYLLSRHVSTRHIAILFFFLSELACPTFALFTLFFSAFIEAEHMHIQKTFNYTLHCVMHGEWGHERCVNVLLESMKIKIALHISTHKMVKENKRVCLFAIISVAANCCAKEGV